MWFFTFYRCYLKEKKFNQKVVLKVFLQFTPLCHFVELNLPFSIFSGLTLESCLKMGALVESAGEPCREGRAAGVWEEVVG